MESLVERLFRETYELVEIPDPPYGGSPHPMCPSQLLSLSSPLVETVPEGGNDPERFDPDAYAWLQHTPHDYFPGLLEATGRSPPPHDLDLDTTQVLQDSTNPSGGNPDRSVC